MLNYWPHDSGMRLNHEVAHLFTKTKYKFCHNLSNKTNQRLYIDILSNSVKHKLFSSVLIELEVLMLDLIELNLSAQVIKLLNDKILHDFVQKTAIHFCLELSIDASSITLSNSKSYRYLQMILLEHRWLLEVLLKYLIFGCVQIDRHIFPFDKNRTPVKHVAVLLENFVVQASNLIVSMIIENFQSLSQMIHFLTMHSLSCSPYTSIRSLALFRNNLTYQNLFCSYIDQPKSIYANRYKVWLISSNGLVPKYIYLFRLDDAQKLSGAKLILISFMELLDLAIPKFENFLLFFIKLSLHASIKIISNGIILLIRSVMSVFKSL